MPRPLIVSPFAIAIAAVALVCGISVRGALAADEPPFAQRVKVQPFPENLTWINTPRPLQLTELRGKFVLLDFWTLGCINCMHVIPELKKLEAAYPKELVVIGVHSAKFTAEKQTRSIKEAVERYGIEHPVVNDADFVLWNRFGVDAWPTLLLIDPEGMAVWGRSGEATFEQLDAVLRKALPFYRHKKLLDPRPLKLGAAEPAARATPLRFPGKVLADEAGGRLFIADSNHNRIVIASLEGKLIETIGGGALGTADGDFAACQFNQPQGMALADEVLYVADTSNHLLRAVDLKQKRVTTLAGTGEQSRKSPPLTPQRAKTTALNSPWDLWLHGDDLIIAMAGPHQLWRLRLSTGMISVFAGNGREDIVDGPPLPKTLYQPGFASFAQPSGLTSDGRTLFVADSEGSSIRAEPLGGRGEVRTLVGTAHLARARLFTFGDVDGDAQSARLQHPLGVTVADGKLYVADTYNHKIKVVDPRSGATRTLVGTGQAGSRDDPAEFNEPGGISAGKGRLYVADTNNHLIRVISAGASPGVTTLVIVGLRAPVAGERGRSAP